MVKRTCIAICGWCPTELPNDHAEVQQHFFIAHGQTGSQSVRYLYPDDVEREFQQWADRVAGGA